MTPSFTDKLRAAKEAAFKIKKINDSWLLDLTPDAGICGATHGEIEVQDLMAVSSFTLELIERYEALEKKLREVPWTEEEFEEENTDLTKYEDGIFAAGFRYGIKWATKRIKEREL